MKLSDVVFEGARRYVEDGGTARFLVPGRGRCKSEFVVRGGVASNGVVSRWYRDAEPRMVEEKSELLFYVEYERCKRRWSQILRKLYLENMLL